MRSIVLILNLLFANLIFCQSSFLDFPSISEFKNKQKCLYIEKFGKGSSKQSLFIVYQNTDSKWVAKLFTDTHTFEQNISGNIFKEENLQQINFKKTWCNILMTDIKYLPKYETIEYKFVQKQIDGSNSKEECDIIEITEIVDHDTCYTIYFKDGENSNEIKYDTFYTNFQSHPNVDELISVNNLIRLIEKEFKIDL